MSTPDPDTLPADPAMTDAAAALMACYNPAPLPAAAPVDNRWADDAADARAAQRTPPHLLAASYNG